MHSFLIGTGYSVIYYITLASLALIIRMFTKVYDELFRKILHFILLGSIFVYLYCFENWYTSAASCLIFSAAVYPALKFFERFRGYSHLLTERSSGELKNSLLIVFFMFSVVIFVCWGILGDRLLCLASVLAWGIGDAMAALIGKRFGKHKIKNTKKSYEGTSAMFLSSFLSVLTILVIRGGINIIFSIVVSAVTALVASVTELYTTGGNDTITCPIASMIVIIIMLYLFGGI
ncbi:MAG: phosphatidate cytidylyltransferase [Eubacteriaceae bacterium]|nr:phosphatidate cytidylyltransferase [Eubacteriaceae bacterium]